jgi:hypothetical protein
MPLFSSLLLSFHARPVRSPRPPPRGGRSIDRTLNSSIPPIPHAVRFHELAGSAVIITINFTIDCLRSIRWGIGGHSRIQFPERSRTAKPWGIERPPISRALSNRQAVGNRVAPDSPSVSCPRNRVDHLPKRLVRAIRVDFRFLKRLVLARWVDLRFFKPLVARRRNRMTVSQDRVTFRFSSCTCARGSVSSDSLAPHRDACGHTGSRSVRSGRDNRARRSVGRGLLGNSDSPSKPAATGTCLAQRGISMAGLDTRRVDPAMGPRRRV